MDKVEYLLTCLSEECAEVQQAVAKAQRFGLDDGHPDLQTTNAEDIMTELTDVIAVMTMLMEAGAIKDYNMDIAIEAKKARVLAKMEYSRERGTLV